MAESSEIQKPHSTNKMLDTANAKEVELVRQPTTIDFQLTKDKTSKKPPLLPRQAWNSQLTYLKVILKAKQTLDKTEETFFISRV